MPVFLALTHCYFLYTNGFFLLFHVVYTGQTASLKTGFIHSWPYGCIVLFLPPLYYPFLRFQNSKTRQGSKLWIHLADCSHCKA